MAEEAFRLASNSRAAFAARSKPSGSNPVTEDPFRDDDDDDDDSGVIALDRLSLLLLLLLRLPPNMMINKPRGR